MFKSTTIPLLRKLFYSLDRKRKSQFFVLIFLNIISSCTEAIAISATYPFLTLLQSPGSIVEKDKVLSFIFEKLSISFEFKAIVIFFMCAILFSSFLKFIVIACNAIYANILAYDFSLASFSSSLSQDYKFFLSNPVSNLVNRNIKGIESTCIVISALLQIITSFFLIVITVTFLIFISPKLTTGIFLFTAFIYTLVFGTFKNYITKASHIIYNNNSLKIKIVQEGYRYFKNIILDKTAYIFFKSYKKNEYQLRRFQAILQIISQCPKIIIENSILLLLGLTALFINPFDKVNFTFLALLGTYALGFQRLLPIAQSMYIGFNDINKFRADLKDVLRLSIEKNQNNTMIPFSKQLEILEIEANKINFSHLRSDNNLLNDVNFILKPGDFLGIIGKSGTGKSTLIDITLGFIKPLSGSINVNGKNIHSKNSEEFLLMWQNSLSYVPQSPLILNDTIKNNLLINGSKRINIPDKEIYEILEIVELKEFVNSLQYRLETILGDDGNSISGGQKQRITIARALLKKGKVLILDESTSGLDLETEKNLLKNIVKKFPKLIIICVSHKPSTIEFANISISLDD
ncbi:ABC transporter ATP-binding protein/permease [Prochlorococcus sp. AH-716-O10]|nr:ABC transporter ATP-binding protein/permease [Prochlorococcus sp. AH-716-O10]